jgi:hypothetical protein
MVDLFKRYQTFGPSRVSKAHCHASGIVLAYMERFLVCARLCRCLKKMVKIFTLMTYGVESRLILGSCDARRPQHEASLRLESTHRCFNSGVIAQQKFRRPRCVTLQYLAKISAASIVRAPHHPTSVFSARLGLKGRGKIPSGDISETSFSMWGFEWKILQILFPGLNGSGY